MAREHLYEKKVDLEIHYLNSHSNSSKKEKIAKARGYKAGDLPSIKTKLKEEKPSLPTYFFRPKIIGKAASFFIQNFKRPQYQSEILYSVKSNPDEIVLQRLFANKITHFDVASMSEIKLIDRLFGKKAKMYFMHPIKSREAIFESYFNFGIRDFSLDSLAELDKILEVLGDVKDLNLHVRLAIPNSHSAIDLSSKFGILPSNSISLIRRARVAAKNLGICFHVGSQCMDPIEYRNAILIAKDAVKEAKVNIDILDIGGGFPSSYPGMKPPNLEKYFNEIFDAFETNFGKNVKIWCEPGRALVAESYSLAVRVEGKKDNMLYLNDGTYGGLFDAGTPGFIFPTKAMSINDKKFDDQLEPFGFYGPTCDSLDVMKGPFYLPKNISEGDYIEIGNLGAYSRSIRTGFNGFDANLHFEISDKPLVSLYEAEDFEITKIAITN